MTPTQRRITEYLTTHSPATYYELMPLAGTEALRRGG